MGKMIKVIIAMKIIVVLFCSCDSLYCGKYTFINKTSYKISLFAYRDGNIISPESINAFYKDEHYEIDKWHCRIGYPGHPFYSSVPMDSVVLFFDDTLRVELLRGLLNYNESVFKEKSPLFPETWVETKTSNGGKNIHYEYVFTNWHYQKALEANLYVMD